MAVSVEQVKTLNGKIEKLNTKRTKVNAQIEMLRSNLEKELARYSEEHSVDLKGKSIRDTVKNILAEQEKVSSEIEAEYTLKSKVVSAIESGNISEANALLGIEEEPEEEEVETVVFESNKETIIESVEVEDDSNDFGLDVGLEVEDDEDDLDFGDLSVEDTDELEEELSPSSRVENIGSSVDSVVKELELDSDDEDGDDDFDDFGFGDLLSGTKLGD